MSERNVRRIRDRFQEQLQERWRQRDAEEHARADARRRRVEDWIDAGLDKAMREFDELPSRRRTVPPGLWGMPIAQGREHPFLCQRSEVASLLGKEAYDMNKKTIAAMGSLGWAGYRLWQKRPNPCPGSAELDETGRIRFECWSNWG